MTTLYEESRSTAVCDHREQVSQKSDTAPAITPLEELARFIEETSYNFDMGSEAVEVRKKRRADPWCGTAGCIAGHAALLWEDVRHAVEEYEEDGFTVLDCEPDCEKLPKKLGLTLGQFDSLCYVPHNSKGDRLCYCDIDKNMAVTAIRRMDRVLQDIPEGKQRKEVMACFDESDRVEDYC